MKFILLCLFSLIASLHAFADTAEDKVYYLLKQDLSKYVKTLSRDIYLYHWAAWEEVSDAAAGEAGPSDPHWKEYYFGHRSLLEGFFHPAQGHDLVGGGMYLSADPYKSRKYGDTLVQVKIKAGTSFLDARSESKRKFEIRRVTYSALINHCPEIKEASSAWRKLGRMTSASDTVSMSKKELQYSDVCRQILNKVFDDLNIQFYAYNWKDSPRKGPCIVDNKMFTDIEGYVIGGKINVHSYEVGDFSMSYDSFELKVFNSDFGQDFSGDDEALKQKIRQDSDYQMAFFINQIYLVQSDYKEQLWNVFSNLANWEKEQVWKKMRVHWFGCGNLFPEDVMRPDPYNIRYLD